MERSNPTTVHPFPSVISVQDEQKLNEYRSKNIHESFSIMGIDVNSFSPEWNKDFRIDSNCPKNGKIGGQDYYPPKAYYHYGLNVSGKYDCGDDIWLGCSNCPGEWCVAYHGTSYENIQSIINSSLRSGNSNAYGKGIYCYPNVNEASEYCSRELKLDTLDGKKKFSFVLMCRVNVNSIHHCSEMPCPEAKNPKYTVHFTTRSDCWFANYGNHMSQYIRPYGILVRIHE
jgi:hypothetical protein